MIEQSKWIQQKMMVIVAHFNLLLAIESLYDKICI